MLESQVCKFIDYRRLENTWKYVLRTVDIHRPPDCNLIYFWKLNSIYIYISCNKPYVPPQKYPFLCSVISYCCRFPSDPNTVWEGVWTPKPTQGQFQNVFGNVGFIHFIRIVCCTRNSSFPVAVKKPYITYGCLEKCFFSQICFGWITTTNQQFISECFGFQVLHLPPASQVPDLKAHLQIRGLSGVGPGRNLGQWGNETYLSLLTWADTDGNDIFFYSRKKNGYGNCMSFFKIIGYSTLALWRRPKVWVQRPHEQLAASRKPLIPERLATYSKKINPCMKPKWLQADPRRKVLPWWDQGLRKAPSCHVSINQLAGFPKATACPLLVWRVPSEPCAGNFPLCFPACCHLQTFIFCQTKAAYPRSARWTLVNPLGQGHLFHYRKLCVFYF